MAGKFKIFCDDCPTRSTFEPEEKTLKREPLGLRQPLQSAADAKLLALSTESSQQQQPPLQPQPLSQQQAQSQQAAASSHSATCSSVLSDPEDQENDISMASLGSDFIPSIIHDDNEFDDNEENSFEVEEDDEDDYEGYSASSEALRGFTCDDEDGLGLTDDEDFEADEELRLELRQAFKQHDDAQVFKSTVYIDDIQCYLEGLEREAELRPLPNYMDFQRDIDSDKRAILINWLVEVSDEYQLQTETLFICTQIIDRFLSKMSIPTSNFQLLGVAAMFIASKYEEIYPPNLYQFVEVTDDTYSGQQIRQMEQEILKTLNFRITLPTITFFLRTIFAFNKFSKKVYHLAEYLCYLSLLAEQPFLEYYPSDIALAAVILAANQLDSAGNISSDLKSAYDKSNMDQLRRRDVPKGTKVRDIERRVYIMDENLPFCIESLRALQQRAYSSTKSRRSSSSIIETAVVTKFSSESYNRVALLQPPKVEDLFLY